MESRSLRKEEKWGLGVAVGLHLALAGVLLFQPSPNEGLEVPERMAVSLASEVSLQSTAPEIVPDSRAAIAPTLAEEAQEAVEQTEVEAAQEVVPSPPPRNSTGRVLTLPPEPAAPAPPRQASGTQVGENFLQGVGSDNASDDTRIPAEQIGRSAQASLRQAINRQIKPHWNAPQGVDADQLVTVLSFRLNEDGTLAARPRVVDQFGVNASNRAQAPLHAERAIRAVQLAAPFDLPDEYHNAWRNITEWRFDRRL